MGWTTKILTWLGILRVVVQHIWRIRDWRSCNRRGWTSEWKEKNTGVLLLRLNEPAPCQSFGTQEQLHAFWDVIFAIYMIFWLRKHFLEKKKRVKPGEVPMRYLFIYPSYRKENILCVLLWIANICMDALKIKNMNNAVSCHRRTILLLINTETDGNGAWLCKLHFF